MTEAKESVPTLSPLAPLSKDELKALRDTETPLDKIFQTQGFKQDEQWFILAFLMGRRLLGQANALDGLEQRFAALVGPAGSGKSSLGMQATLRLLVDDFDKDVRMISNPEANLAWEAARAKALLLFDAPSSDQISTLCSLVSGECFAAVHSHDRNDQKAKRTCHEPKEPHIILYEGYKLPAAFEKKNDNAGAIGRRMVLIEMPKTLDIIDPYFSTEIKASLPEIALKAKLAYRHLLSEAPKGRIRIPERFQRA